MNRLLLLLCCICVPWMARGQAAYDWCYWFDRNHAARVSGHAFGNHFTIETDAIGLSEGFHTINMQVADSAGRYSSPLAKLFYYTKGRSQTHLHYWFDEDEQTRKTMPFMDKVMMIDVSDLQEGFHVLHIQIFDVAVSDIITTMFIKVPQTEGVGDMTCICSVDGKLIAKETLPTTGGILKWDMDVDNMDMGIHKAMFQVITPSGAASSIAERYFVRAITNTEIGNMKCVYTIDDFDTYYQAGTLSDGLFHFDLDVVSIENGLHRIAYTLVSETGITLPRQTAFFWKTPLGGEGIVQYDYWVNENDGQKHVVKLDQHTNPFSLITLLPVETQPIRSSNFQFAIKNGEPLINARNDFHIQFFDTNGRMVEESKEYVDEQVSAAVEPVGDLQATQTFGKVAENDVRWYTIQLAPGDSVAFKLSQAGTVQVFAPSGAEVFKTSESESVKWGGIHVWEDGTYYLAVHDVTGSQNTMKLEYMHMDKYDVVDWDVHTVGSGGCSTITFKGNGFRDLYAVDLIVAPGDTIRSVDVSHDSDAETAVTFDFTDATLGDYNAVFHFTDEDKHVSDVVTVEEAIDIELATDVSFPSSFLRGTSTTYTIKITNKGNMTAYAVPIYTWLKSKTLNDISHIEYEGLDLDDILDYLDKDSLLASDIESIQAYNKQKGDDHYFLKFWVEDEDNPGDSVVVRSNYFYTNIAPNETKTLQLTIYTRNVDAFAYFTIPDEWPTYSIDENSESFVARARFASKKSESWYCCYRDRIECVANIVVDGLDIASLFSVPGPIAVNIASCVAGVVNQVLTAAGDTYCGTNDVEGDFKKKVDKVVKGISIVGALTSCASSFGVKNASEITVAIDNLLHPSAAVNCIQAFFSKKPNCPPKPPKGGKSKSQPPADPNDIFGYLSEAGSKFIADSVARVNYTIEFENDTTFAEASAHTIVIKDTLDSRYFDLTKFMPTGVRLGEHDVFLNEADIVTNNDKTTFVKTIDMRPEINAIAQVNGEYNQKNGIAQWTFQSLDPMTMEPTDDLMQGILPVNYDGTSGIGEVMFEIGVKQGKADGTQIKNRAGIVFDYEEAILTPTWTNIVDAVAPSSVINDSWMVNDSTLRITADGFDARSGVWKYEWYVQAGENAPWWKEGETESASFDYHIYEGIDYGFCVLAVDSAGNVEQKVIQRERGFKTYGPDYEDNIDDVNGQWSIINGQSIYDLSGRKHEEPQENQVNIIDKKKVLFRRKGK